MNDIRTAMSWLIPYVASVVLTKGVALITLPLLTSHLEPADFGRLELVVSVIEIAGLILCFCAADLLFRFTGTTNLEESRRNAGGIAGGALALSFIVGGLLQAGLFLGRKVLEPAIDVNLLAVGLLCASFSALIELPLAWLRSRGSATTFLYYVGARSLMQTGVMALTLTHGYGAFGVIAGNAAVDGAFSIALLWRQARDTGLRYDPHLLARAARYGWPLLGGGVAMFILGNCDRWFLAGAVSREELGHYALASKLSTIVALAMQPFGLWWNARRMRVLHETDGKRRSADAVAWGFACVAIGAIWVALIVPEMIVFALPNVYSPSIQWLPWLILIVAMNETSALLNVSVYLGERATAALFVNGFGALTALAGYIFLVPDWGIPGAIAATIAGHGVRVVAYAIHGAHYAPIPYRWAAMAGMTCLAFSSIQFVQALGEPLPRVLLMLASSLSIVAIAAMGRDKLVPSIDATPA